MSVQLQDNQCKAQNKVAVMYFEIFLEKDVFSSHSSLFLDWLHAFL